MTKDDSRIQAMDREARYRVSVQGSPSTCNAFPTANDIDATNMMATIESTRSGITLEGSCEVAVRLPRRKQGPSALHSRSV